MTHALLIDGENVSSANAPAILTPQPEAFAIRRVYGDFDKLNGWRQQQALKVIHAPEGRNSADILLAIEAITMVADGTRSFVIVTADGGLVHLVRHLREIGCRVVVMADKRASPALRLAGHSFVELSPPEKPAAETGEAMEAPPARKPDSALPKAPAAKRELQDFVLDVVSKAGKAGMLITDLNPLAYRETGIKIGTQPEKTWRAWLTAPARHGRFVCDPRGPFARVRLAAPSTP